MFSLISQLVTKLFDWRMNGRRVEVNASRSLYAYPDGSPGDKLLINLQARNMSRAMTVFVSSWGLDLDDGKSIYYLEQLPGSDSLPTELSPQKSAQWFLSLLDLSDEARTHKQARPFVDLQSGHREHGDWFPLSEWVDTAHSIKE